VGERTLTPETWRQRRRQPEVATLATLGGAKIVLKPMSALARLNIDKEYPDEDGNTKRLAALIARTAVTGEIDGDAITNIGDSIWTVDELLSDEFPNDALNELSGKVIAFMMPKEADRKNSTPANGLPSASP
jgi:hypothetical protein